MTRRRLTMLPVAAAAALLAGGCVQPGTTDPHEAHEGHSAHRSATAPPTTTGRPAPVMTVQQLADTVGCQPQPVGTTTDFHQATCAAGAGQFVLLDFATPDGQRAWLDTALAYGGAYLVGDRWVLSGPNRQQLDGMQARLGGDIEGGS